MKELTIRFNYDESDGGISFFDNPFDVFVDGTKVERLKSISMKFSKDEPIDLDSFRYNIEQYFDWYGDES